MSVGLLKSRNEELPVCQYIQLHMLSQLLLCLNQNFIFIAIPGLLDVLCEIYCSEMGGEKSHPSQGSSHIFFVLLPVFPVPERSAYELSTYTVVCSHDHYSL
jgi:hypothetical protein